MIQNASRVLVEFLFLAIILVSGSQVDFAQAEDSPVIHIDKTRHSFSKVFEGDELSHTFTVFNQGTADLKIKRLSPS